MDTRIRVIGEPRNDRREQYEIIITASIPTAEIIAGMMRAEASASDKIAKRGERMANDPNEQEYARKRGARIQEGATKTAAEMRDGAEKIRDYLWSIEFPRLQREREAERERRRREWQ